MSSTTHLGFEYTCDDVKPITEKTQAIVDWPTPSSHKEVRSFLELANFIAVLFLSSQMLLLPLMT